MCRRLAAIVFLVAACGDDSPVRHLDGGLDSPVDIDAAMAGPVTLTVRIGDQPQENVRVYFQASDSTVIASALTDAAGVASAVMPNGGYVTAIDPFDRPIPAGLPAREVVTYAGVKPGDHLVMAERPNDSQPLTVEGAIDSGAGIVGHYLRASCAYSTSQGTRVGGSASPLRMSYDVLVPPSCATADFLTWSIDDGNGAVNYAYVPNKAIAATLDLTGSALTTAATQKTYTINNSTAFEAFDIDQRLLSAHGQLWDQGGITFDPDDNLLLATSMAVPAFTGAIDLVNAKGFRGASQHWFVDWGPFSAQYTLDAGSRALRNVTSGPELDTTTHQVTWVTEQTGVVPDFVALEGTAATNKMFWHFRVIAPYGSSVTLPTLPTDEGNYNIGAGDAHTFEVFAMGKVPGGYDAVRPHAYEAAQALGDFDVPTSVVLSPTGSATFELWQLLRINARTRPALRMSAPSGVGHNTILRATEHK